MAKPALTFSTARDPAVTAAARREHSRRRAERAPGVCTATDAAGNTRTVGKLQVVPAAARRTAPAVPQDNPASSHLTPERTPTMASAKKSASKKSAPKPADRSAAVAASWANPETAAARATHTNVKVGGEVYRSVAAAFTALGLDMGQHVRFRMALKASPSGRATFEDASGAKHIFTTVARAAE